MYFQKVMLFTWAFQNVHNWTGELKCSVMNQAWTKLIFLETFVAQTNHFPSQNLKKQFEM